MTTELLASFGKYTDVQRLGEGGFGEVYRAVDTTLNRPVALKVPHRELLRDPGFVAQFRAEAQTAAQLDHPNIVRIYSVGEFEGTPFIEMELVDGQTLADLIRAKGRLTPEEALAIIEPVCAALEEAHRKGIIHRDIKPGNILIRASDGRVLVSDFGLAKSRELSFQASLSSSNVVVGTFRYIPPEQANPKLGAIGPASDVYSLGVVLYEMLTGRVPFESKSVGQLIYQHTSEPPEPPSNININLSQPIESVVLKALSKRSEDRYHSADALAQALAQAVTTASGASASASPSSAAPASTEVQLPFAVSPMPGHRLLIACSSLVSRVKSPFAVSPMPVPRTQSKPTATSRAIVAPVAPPQPSGALVGRESSRARVGFLLEFLGFVGLLGIGWLYMGETRTGILLLVGWLLLITMGSCLIYATFGVVGVCLAPVFIVVPIYSAVRLWKRYQHRQESVPMH